MYWNAKVVSDTAVPYSQPTPESHDTEFSEGCITSLTGGFVPGQVCSASKKVLHVQISLPATNSIIDLHYNSYVHTFSWQLPAHSLLGVY